MYESYLAQENETLQECSANTTITADINQRTVQEMCGDNFLGPTSTSLYVATGTWVHHSKYECNDPVPQCGSQWSVPVLSST